MPLFLSASYHHRFPLRMQSHANVLQGREVTVAVGPGCATVWRPIYAAVITRPNYAWIRRIKSKGMVVRVEAGDAIKNASAGTVFPDSEFSKMDGVGVSRMNRNMQVVPGLACCG